jgi:hypothetical protein
MRALLVVTGFLLAPLRSPLRQVAVHFMGSVAEALLQLPEVPFSRADAAAAAGVPSGLWLTAGLLAADGFALQLRLRKADKVGWCCLFFGGGHSAAGAPPTHARASACTRVQPKERDRAEGGWCAYHPVGGAITVLSTATSGDGDAGGGAKAGKRSGITVLATSSSAAAVSSGLIKAKAGSVQERSSSSSSREDVATVRP